MKDIKHATIYARVSSEEQAESGTSLATQIKACRKYCAEHGIVVHQEFQEDYTGTTLDRPVFREVLRQLDQGKANVLVVYNSDRLSRDYIDFLVLRDQLEQSGIQLHFVDRGQSQTGFEGLLTDGIMALIAHGERERIIQRTREGKFEKARDGKLVVSIPPYGYDKVSKDLVINEFESGIVRKIFSWYALGDNQNKPMSLRGIARKLTELGIPTPAKRDYVADVWRYTTIRGILMNEIYIGKYYYGKTQMVDGRAKKRPRSEWIRIDVPELAFIEQNLFDLCQRRLASNKKYSRRNADKEYLLQGILRCGTCGKIMSCNHWQDRDFYVCSTRGLNKHDPLRCKHSNIVLSRNIADRIIWGYLVWFISDEYNIDNAFKQVEERAEEINEPLQARYNSLERMIRKEETHIERMINEIGSMQNEIIVEKLKEQLDVAGNKVLLMREEMEKISKNLEQTYLSPRYCQNIKTFADTLYQRLDRADFSDMRNLMQILDVRAEFLVNSNDNSQRQLKIKFGFSADAQTISLDESDKFYVASVMTNITQNHLCFDVAIPISPDMEDALLYNLFSSAAINITIE